MVDLQWGTMTLDDGSKSGGFLRQSLRGGTSPPMNLLGSGGSVLRRYRGRRIVVFELGCEDPIDPGQIYMIQGLLAMLPSTTPDGELMRNGGEKKTIWIVEEEGKLSNKASTSRNFCLSPVDPVEYKSD